MNCFYLSVFVFGVLLPSISCRQINFYRRDYTYFEEFDAFYKLHWDENGSSWNSAFSRCYDEGATLFYPKAKDEWTLVKNLSDKMTEAPNKTDIFVGLHDKFALGEFITVDGQTTPYPMSADSFRITDTKNCGTMNILTGVSKVDACITLEDSPLPFVCKKVNTVTCPTIDPDYKYSKDVHKCYKINRKPNTWTEAMKTCFMEGGVLAVIENGIQADIINAIMTTTEIFYVGAYKLLDSFEFYSVKGRKISEMYQNKLSDDDARYSDLVANYNNIDQGNCGVVYSSNQMYTTTTECNNILPFICEMNVPSQ